MKTKIKYYLKALYIRFKGRPGALKKAIRRARRKQKRMGKRIRVFFVEQKYQALSRPEIQQKKRTGQWSRNVNVTKMEPLCFYDTLIGLTHVGAEILAPSTLNPKL